MLTDEQIEEMLQRSKQFAHGPVAPCDETDTRQIMDKWIRMIAAEVRRLMEEQKVLALERRVSDSEMNALLKRVNREFQTRTEEAEEALRSLASWLGAGGYNAPAVDAKVFEAKIRAGVDMLLAPITAERDRLREERRWRECAKEPPTPHERVNAYNRDSALYFSGHFEQMCGNRFRFAADYGGWTCLATHWQPLPQPPEPTC